MNYHKIWIQATDEISVCPMCKGRNMIMRDNGIAHWFDCQLCGYSSPGRNKPSEAMADVEWAPLVEKPLG